MACCAKKAHGRALDGLQCFVRDRILWSRSEPDNRDTRGHRLVRDDLADRCIPTAIFGGDDDLRRRQQTGQKQAARGFGK